jgi:hypothetical protein
MSLLDLQGMQLVSGNEAPAGGGVHSASGSAHESCNASDLSALLCGGHSVLSLTLCGD